ncbi:HEPN domain-containing protein [Saccharothrix carnea]|uniref:HEPN domain-containing protein n=1 Tax=Saccharothrix carnea TaxID=1280637 RepID=UPI0011B1E63C|nr:HEPN domain-containing protein [Saccharothrix carnea]
MKASAWPPFALASLERSLDALVEAVKDPSERNDDEQMWLTRFLVVRACGYLEQVVHETSIGFLHEHAGGTSLSFSLSWMARSRNPSPENLTALLGRFDQTWKDEFEEFINADDGHIKAELHLLVGRRNQIAHGLNEGLNSRRAIDLVKISKEVADWFIRRLNPTVGGRSWRQ